MHVYKAHFDLKLAQLLVEEVLGALLLLADLLLELLALTARQVRQVLLRGHRAHYTRESKHTRTRMGTWAGARAQVQTRDNYSGRRFEHWLTARLRLRLTQTLADSDSDSALMKRAGMSGAARRAPLCDELRCDVDA